MKRTYSVCLIWQRDTSSAEHSSVPLTATCPDQRTRMPQSVSKALLGSFTRNCLAFSPVSHWWWDFSWSSDTDWSTALDLLAGSRLMLRPCAAMSFTFWSTAGLTALRGFVFISWGLLVNKVSNNPRYGLLAGGAGNVGWGGPGKSTLIFPNAPASLFDVTLHRQITKRKLQLSWSKQVVYVNSGVL